LLEVIQGEIRRLDALVEKFLGLSRPDRICREKEDLGSTISELLELFAEEAKGKGIQLQSSIPPDLPQLTMDRERMREAFLNLIKNAMEAMNAGGVLRVEARRLDSRRLEVSFSDSGCGISASEQHKIFDPYFTSKKGGQGLGLSLTYQIIRSHGGEIRCESELGRGSRFFVILPYGEEGQLG
jgi:signal transduction histidine kinase